MEEQIKQSLHAWKVSRNLPPYSDKTVNQYLSNIRRIAPKGYTNMDWAMDHKAIAKKLSHYKSTTQRNYYNSLLIGLYNTGYKGAEITKYYEGIRDLLNAQYEQKPKEKPDVTAEDIDDMLESMASDLEDWKTHLAYVVFHIHKRYQFRNDLSGMIVTDKDDPKLEINKLVVNNGRFTFVLYQYKTKKKYGRLIKEIEDPELQSILSDWVNRLDARRFHRSENPDHTYLVQYARTGNPLTRDELSKVFRITSKKYLDNAVGATMLRKIYTLIPKDPINASPEEILQLQGQANISGHALTTKATIYSYDD